jgi:hypothetical protein
MLVLPSHRCPQDAEELARLFRSGPALPFRRYLACWRPCGAPLDVSGTVSAHVLQWASDAAVFGANATFGCNVRQIMVAAC